MNIVMNRHLAIDFIHLEPFEHGRKDFNRECAKKLAEAITKHSCMVTQTEYDMRTARYHTTVSMLVGRKERILP